MDFPVCPACGQSVIDDDVEDCPFCGSSMKAKPGSKPSATKPAAGASAKPGAAAGKPAAAAATKPAGSSRSTAGTASSGGRAGAADDFPFENELPSAKTAIQAMPNATKQRSLQVVCPMCETVGYVPPTAAGQDVKCANPKCMVPVFKAPAPKVEAPPPPPKKSKLPMVFGGIAVVALIVVGVFVVPGLIGSGGSGKKPGELSEEAKAELAEMNARNKKPAVPSNSTGTTTNDHATKTSTTDTKTEAPKSKDELVAAALKQMSDASLMGDRRQRSKPFCRQQAAEACILAGEVAAAREHLAQLANVGRDVPYYRVVPNLELFWREWSAGNKAEATKSLDAALADAPKIPKVGRTQLEIAARLAAALAAAGRVPEALAALEGHQSNEADGQLAARVQMASDGQVARLTNSRTVLPWSYPQAVAATVSLLSHQQTAAARTWALAQSKDEAKAECLAAWAEGVARTQAQPGKADSNAELVDAVKSLAPPLAARVWARAASGRFGAKDREGTAATLKLASDLLSKVAAPSEPTMPDIKQTMKYKPPASALLAQAATAAAEIAFVQSLSPETLKDAEATLDLALQYARGLAPGWPAVSERVQDADEAGSGLRDQLKRELNLKTDDDARQQVGNYRRALTGIADASRQRVELQVKVLSRLMQAGLKDKVWTVVSTRSAETDPNRRDGFLTTPLVAELIEVFHGTETEKAILGALEANRAPERPASARVKEALNKGDAQQAAELISNLPANADRDDIALTFATSLATSGKLDLALQFVGRFDDIVLREEAYRLIAALAAQRDQTEAIWKQIELTGQATEKVALCRGLIGGLKTAASSNDLPEVAAAR